MFTGEAIRTNRDAAATMDVERRIRRSAAGWLFLTEHRARLGPPTGLVVTEEDGLVRITTGPSGPAGTTTVSVGGAAVTVDAAEPERVLEVFATTEGIEAAGLGDMADLDVDRMQRQLRNHVAVAAAARDVEVLGEWASTADDLRRLAGAVYVLAERLEAAGDVEAARRWGRTGDGYLPGIEPLEEELLARRRRLDHLLGAMPEQPRAEAAAFRGAVSGPNVPTFMGGRLGPSESPSVDEQLRDLAAGEPVPFELLPGPLLRVRLDREADQPDVFLLSTTSPPRMAEAVCRVWGPTAVTFPTLGCPSGEVERVPLERGDRPGRSLARRAIAEQLAGEASSATWFEAAHALLAEDEPDKAALALLRSLDGYPGPHPAGDAPEEVLDRLHRAALLGSNWALNRPPLRNARSDRDA
jgi:hypothetical protein